MTPDGADAMRFEFATATRILFGPGTWREVGPAAAEFGRRALLVTGKTTERAAPLRELLAAQGVESLLFSVAGEPTVETVRRGVQEARQAGSDSVLGFGGGSVLDTAKAVAALMTNGGDPLDYLEIIGRGAPLTQPSAPCIAIPTTAGTGAEVTRNAVLGSPEHRVKVSLRSATMLPRLAVVDPELTCGLPPDITAHTGMDALTQVIEPYVSNRANPMTDLFCREGMARAARALRRACEQGDDRSARADMALASLFGGLALANARLGAVHGFAGPIGGMFPAPHGTLCACLLPPVLAANVRALRQRDPDGEALRRCAEIGRILTGRPDATADDAVTWVRELRAALPVPSLAAYGITPPDFPAIIEKASVASSMQGNPLPLTPEEMRQILQEALTPTPYCA
jgi:alcohol dehydrogenase class IV